MPIIVVITDRIDCDLLSTLPVNDVASHWQDCSQSHLCIRTKRPLTLALLSVYDKANLIDLATALSQSGVRLLGSGGTAKKIRDAGLPIECVGDASSMI